MLTMKLIRFGAFALLASTAFIGCSSDKTGGPSEKQSSVSFDLTTSEGVVITTVNYDLNTSGGADVANGSIAVPNPNSTISLGIESLPAPGSYTLAFAATGMYQGQQVPCVSAPTPFSLASGQDLTLPTINLVCTIENPLPDDTGSVNADVNVVVETINVGGNIVEVFSYGPRSVAGVNVDGVCTFPAIQLNVFNNNAAISYAWTAAPDGDFALNATSTSGTYTCESGGTKTLTLTATMGTTVQSKSVTVNCAPCTGVVCGNAVVEGTEQCDEATPRCTACVITPVCGDGVVDGPAGDCAGPIDAAACVEQCDHAGAPGPACDVNCVIPVPTCDDGVQNGDEEGIDCGGSCPDDCPVEPTCDDGVQNGDEEGVDCGGSCPNACVDECDVCLHTAPETAEFQTAACDPDPLCLAAQECVLEAGCFIPVPGQCYCGIGADLDACEQATFVPFGPCIAPLVAGLGSPANNQEVLDRMFDFNFSTGNGMLILEEASRACTTECF
jgi:hypothetical protein